MTLTVKAGSPPPCPGVMPTLGLPPPPPPPPPPKIFENELLTSLPWSTARRVREACCSCGREVSVSHDDEQAWPEFPVEAQGERLGGGSVRGVREGGGESVCGGGGPAMPPLLTRRASDSLPSPTCAAPPAPNSSSIAPTKMQAKSTIHESSLTPTLLEHAGLMMLVPTPRQARSTAA